MGCKIILEEKQTKNNAEYHIDIDGQSADLIMLMVKALQTSDNFVEIVETAFVLYEYEKEKDEDIFGNIN